jgi:hypothetical protein
MALRRLLLPAAVAGLATGLLAHVRLVHPSNGNPLYWSNPGNVEIVLQDAGSDDIPDASDETALRMAIAAWNATTGTAARLVEDTSPASQARTDWESSNLHLVLFDETNASGYFPGVSGIVALTPVWFFSGGTITDADVLFNGQDHRFTTSQVPGRFDVQDVAAHELGHLLGLDHSPWAGATMYPFVDPAVILQRSLSEDELHGLRDAYPSGGFGQITGNVERASNGSNVVGAHVVARDAAGRTAASILTNGSGNFTLRGLDPGTYTVYAVPLGDGTGTGTDAPVDESNLTSWLTIQTDFEPAIYGATATISGANTVALGTLEVGADVALNLGIESDRFPVRCIAGASTTVLLHGAGLSPTATVTASDPDLVLGVSSGFGSQISFQVTVPFSEPAGHVDLAVMDLGRLSILPAALEITPPSPSVTSVTPSTGASGGGTAVTIGGANFEPGARIVIGDQIYVDGVAGTAVVDSTSIQLTTLPTLGGMHDVVVIDASGVEGRDVAAFQVMSAPLLASVFPQAADALGGTEVVLAGEDFQSGAVVRIDGVAQGPVSFESSSLLRFTTQPGVLGVQSLEVENPDGGATTGSFTFVAQADPSISSVAPASGKKSGGQTITVFGANFTAASQVLFDVDPDTGGGGVAAAGVTFVDTATLSVVTPALATQGAKSLCVLDGSTGQAAVLPGAFLATSGGGGGGGGCSIAPFDEPRRPGAGLAGAWWLALVLLALLLRARRAAPTLA